jgi:hypothetical protein
MKEVFEDGSYLEIITKKNKVIVTIAARDENDKNSVLMISVDMDKDKFLKSIKDL